MKTPWSVDAPWAPLYLVLIWALHPALGWCGALTVTLMLALAELNERFNRRALEGPPASAPRQQLRAELVAGESSLARLLAGVSPPASGSVRPDGADMAYWPRRDLGRTSARCRRTSSCAAPAWPPTWRGSGAADPGAVAAVHAPTCMR